MSILIITFLLIPIFSYSQKDSIKIDFSNVFRHSLAGNIPEALKGLETKDEQHIIKRHRIIRDEILNRFAYEKDESGYSARHSSCIDSLLHIYKAYWRKSFLEFPVSQDSLLIVSLKGFFQLPDESYDSITHELDVKIKSYVKNYGLKTTGFSKTGKYYDLLVWQTERDTIYHFNLTGEKITCAVIFMDDFITLGWQEYATADKLHPGGWAGTTNLYCVKKAYDLKSESFLVSYLLHEGRHFDDYKKFPGLSNTELEYRAKLTELMMAESTLYTLITFFIANADLNSGDAHQIANYNVIHGLSRSLFNRDFEREIAIWKNVSPSKIKKFSKRLLKENTRKLQLQKVKN